MSIGEIDTKEGFSPTSDIVRGMAKPERTDEDRIRIPSVTRVIQQMSPEPRFGAVESAKGATGRGRGRTCRENWDVGAPPHLTTTFRRGS